MAAIYARWILSGRMTLEDVPEKWRTETAALIAPTGDDAP